MSRSKVDPILLEKAKKMYMEYTPVSSISRHINVPKTTLQHYCTNYWHPEREMARAELFQKMTDTKRVDFARITEATICIMTRALQNLAARSEPPTMAEASKASEILSSLDKITRLDDGNPTDIISNQEKVLTVETIRKKLSLDPFDDMSEATYKEIEDDSAN